ncbi:MAG TPA: radical SAM/SPASM domain-containing protein [Syntrophales bacterium]|nr:radical SAM/SPASM domain-containing protein [Syntrophales bacterium]
MKILAFTLPRIPGVRTGGPAMVTVEVTNECPFTCVTCPREAIPCERGYISYDLFRKICEECGDNPFVAELTFSGMGEPLLHRDVISMAALAKKQGIPKVRLLTNGLLLDRYRTGEILERGDIDEIGVSLDALTENTFFRVKGSRGFRTIEENLRHFLKERRKRRTFRPFVSLHMLQTREAAAETGDFIRKWEPELGRGDKILIKDAHSFAGQVPGMAPAKKAEAERLPCRQLWEYLYISWDGDVMPCCMDVFRKMRLGNLQTQTLREIWKGGKLAGLRRIHREGGWNRLPLCETCDTWWYLRPMALDDRKTRRTPPGRNKKVASAHGLCTMDLDQ